jgi:deoxyadenosine/deoxycytidine kinase
MKRKEEHLRIEICGGIASGKTTLAALCREAGFSVRNERFQENPFFEKFYADPKAYAFEAELTYLLQHFSQSREAASEPRLAVDFSFVLDLAYARVTLQDVDQSAFDSLLTRVIEKIGLPALIVRLECPTDIELSRIQRRNRAAEQRMAAPFLCALDCQIELALGSPRFSCVPICRIDSSRVDFRPEGKDRHQVLERLIAAIGAAR